MGDPDAPAQIICFTDSQCSFSQRYVLKTVPTLVENLVETLGSFLLPMFVMGLSREKARDCSVKGH